jgi:hypothetical protein
VITRDQALAIARPWASASLPACNGNVGLWEFDLGYVVWPKLPPSPDPSRPPAVIGAPRAVIDKQTGELSVWPSLSSPAVAGLYQQSRAEPKRFPDDVRAMLRAAGWFPGRDISVQVADWLSRVHEEQPVAQELLPMFPVARAALAEFGGLQLEAQRRYGNPHGGFRIETWPDVGRVVLETYTDWAITIGASVFPLAWYEDGSSDIVVDERGRVYLLGLADNYLVAETVDEAIIALLRSAELTVFDGY